jgi:ATP-binding cassette subfamily B protein
MARRRPFAKLRRVMDLLKPHAAGEGPRLVAGALLGVAVIGLQVLRPWPLKWILDSLSGAAPSGPPMRSLEHAPLATIGLFSVLFIVIALLAAAAEFGQVLIVNGLGNRVLFRFRAALFIHVLRQPLAFHQAREVGELLTRVVYDTSRLRRGLNGLLIRIVQTVALFTATFAVLLWLDTMLGLLLALGGTLALAAMQKRGRRIARAARRQRSREGGLAALVAGELESIRELQTFGLDGSEVQRRFAQRNDRSLFQEQKVRRLAAGMVLRVEVLLAASIALALWLGARGVIAGRLTPGDLVLFFSYAMALRAHFADFAYQTARLGRTYACAERLASIAERTTAITDLPDAQPAPRLQGVLQFDDVALKTPKRRRAGRKWTLNGLSCELPTGHRIAVLGDNGAGKSTMLSLVLRLADPDRGAVRLDGRDLRSYTIDSVRSQVSVMFQDSVLTGLSVRENIALGLSGVSLDAVSAAAWSAQVSDFIERLPLGYETPVRRGGNLFSGGERRRLALARALLRDGRVWLLDEPVSGLDHDTARSLTELLLRVTEGRTTLWVTHDPELVDRLDWVLVLEQGAAAFSGSPASYHDWCAHKIPAAHP